MPRLTNAEHERHRVAVLNHAFYATQPGDCLCTMCLGDCAACGKPADYPAKSRAKRGWTPYCEKCLVKRVNKKVNKKVGG